MKNVTYIQHRKHAKNTIYLSTEYSQKYVKPMRLHSDSGKTGIGASAIQSATISQKMFTDVLNLQDTQRDNMADNSVDVENMHNKLQANVRKWVGKLTSVIPNE